MVSRRADAGQTKPDPGRAKAAIRSRRGAAKTRRIAFLTLELWMQAFLDGSAAGMTDLTGRAIA